MSRARLVRVTALAGVAVIVLAVVGRLGWPVLSLTTRWFRNVAWQGSGIAKYHQAFLDDQRLAGTLPVLARTPATRDAAPLLAPRVRWREADRALLRRLAEESPVPLVGPVVDPKPVLELGDAWLEADPSLWSTLDFSWMSRLADYDYWDLERASPGGVGPAWESVAAWAKLRLAKGHREGAPALAIAEVEQLARLCLTTERTYLVATGAQLLAYVGRARERAAAGGKADIGAKLGYSLVERVVRAAFAARAYARLHTPESYDADFTRIAIGRCAAIRDGLESALVARPFLRQSHAAEYARLDRLLAGASDCRIHDLRRRWAEPDLARLPELGEEVDHPVLATILRLAPGLFIGEWMLSAVEPAESEVFGGYAPGPRAGT